jgi:hypothetical protein
LFHYSSLPISICWFATIDPKNLTQNYTKTIFNTDVRQCSRRISDNLKNFDNRKTRQRFKPLPWQTKDEHKINEGDYLSVEFKTFTAKIKTALIEKRLTGRLTA